MTGAAMLHVRRFIVLYCHVTVASSRQTSPRSSSPNDRKSSVVGDARIVYWSSSDYADATGSTRDRKPSITRLLIAGWRTPMQGVARDDGQLHRPGAAPLRTSSGGAVHLAHGLQ